MVNELKDAYCFNSRYLEVQLMTACINTNYVHALKLHHSSSVPRVRNVYYGLGNHEPHSTQYAALDNIKV